MSTSEQHWQYRIIIHKINNFSLETPNFIDEILLRKYKDFMHAF